MVPPSITMALESPAPGFLIARALPAMAYFFVFYGGPRAAIRGRPKIANDIANLSDRFLEGPSGRLVSAGMDGFVESGHPDSMLDPYRKKCGLLDPLVNSTPPAHKTPLSEPGSVVDDLRRLATPS